MENNKKDSYESVSGKGYKSKKPVKKRKRNKPVFSNLKKYIGIVIGIVCIALVAIYVNGTVYYTTHFYKGTHINGIDVSKLTADEVENAIKDYELTITERGKEKSATYIETLAGKDIDMKVVSRESLDNLVKEQNQFVWFTATGTNHEEKQMIEYDSDKLAEFVKNLKGLDSKYADKPTNASISDYNNGYTIVEAKQGNFLNKKKTIECLENTISSLKEKVDLDKEGCYRVPKIASDSEQLTTVLDQLNKYTGTTITYNFGDTQEVVDGSVISGWLVVDGNNVSLSKEKVDEFVDSIRKKYDTIFSNREFKTTYGKTVKVSGGDYGWWLNTAKESEGLMQQIENGESGERKPVYYQEAASHGKKDYGDSYVEINLTSQHLFVYKDGQKVLDTDFVSGNISTNHGTHTGTYGITYKERYSVLVGETYESTVSYWMPFDEDIGMHDAIWKSQFGSNFYKTDGSHGCINLPYLTAKKIYGYVEKGTPVIVYELPGTESGSVTYQNSSEIAQAAIEAIDAIGNVTKNSGDTIKDARYMYNKINSDAKKYVTNYDKLQAAEKKFKEYSN